jgi:hypothetical protein
LLNPKAPEIDVFRGQDHNNALLGMSPVRSMTAKCVDRSGSGLYFATVLDTARNEVFFPGPHRNSLAIDN